MTDSNNFSTVHGFEQNDLEAIIGGVNSTVGDKFQLAHLTLTTRLIEAENLEAAKTEINNWVKSQKPMQGWTQNFSTKEKWIEGFTGFKDEDIPVHAEFICENGTSLLVKHVGGYKWRLVTISESESNENKGRDNLCAAQDFSLLCNASGIERMNYTQYWDGEDGALIPFMERFMGFSEKEDK